MNPFMHGFAEELVKLGFGGAENVGPTAYDGASSIAQSMVPRKGPPKSSPPPVARNRDAPTALTTPAELAGRTGSE